LVTSKSINVSGVSEAMATMPPKMGVALQGGGSHGAFTRGALNRLLRQSAMVIMMSRVWSPQDLNPFNYHPLRDLLDRSVDFEGLRAQDAVQVMVCATNVRTGRRRIVFNAELSTEAVGRRSTIDLAQLLPVDV
jgi:predicted acylesterase/phospholipase RssA